MQFKNLALLAFAAVAAAAVVPGRGGNADDVAVSDFIEKCKSQSHTVVCCKEINKDSSKGVLTGSLDGEDVTCNSVPSNVMAGTFAQTQAQCGGGIACCSLDAIQSGIVDTSSGCVAFPQ